MNVYPMVWNCLIIMHSRTNFFSHFILNSSIKLNQVQNNIHKISLAIGYIPALLLRHSSPLVRQDFVDVTLIKAQSQSGTLFVLAMNFLLLA